jgi:simple sugar transport system ATP-binding protein
VNVAVPRSTAEPAEPGEARLLEVDRVSKSFGATRALDGVSLTIAPASSHALVGRNGAGKSTLVRILTGLIEPDSGTVRFGGEAAPDRLRHRTWSELVQCVYQQSTVIPDLTVGENLFLARSPGPSRSLVSWKRIRTEGRALLDDWGLDVAVDAKASSLTVGNRQLVEIARALNAGSSFIVLDEPTSQLHAGEIGTLFERMNRLRERGVAFLYISHHLPEIYEVCDEVTVLRDGGRVLHAPVAAVSHAEIVAAMVGEVERTAPRTAVAPGSDGDPDPPSSTVLRVTDLAAIGCFDSVSFEVSAGERVGVAGITGCGKEELAGAIAGIIKPTRGRVEVDGVRLRSGRVDDAIDNGIGFVPGDRYAAGFCPNLTTEENLTSTVLRRLGRLGLVHTGRRRNRALALMRALQIVARSPRQPTRELSGGNQQKAVVGRALAAGPRALVLVAPTAGVDVASKAALFEWVREQRSAVLIVSDDLDELALCDRVLVMVDGRIHAELGADRDHESLVAAMEGVGR